MYKQMNMFDFIEALPEIELSPARPHTQFEHLFEKVKDPVCLCANCLCQYCANNVEQSQDRVKSGEMLEPCFNCDECKLYSGEKHLISQRRKECLNFVMSDYGASKNRKRFQLIKG